MLARPHPQSAHSGFTLIELSIVLVIIGLLTGGILAGKELIKSAKIRAQISQIEEFDQAVGAFEGKYNSLPGDIKEDDAYQLGLTNCCIHSGLEAATYGNGNNRIDDGQGNYPIAYSWAEPYLFFIQLSDAGLLKQSLKIVPSHYVIGENFPSAKIGRGIIPTSSGDGNLYYFLGLNNSTTDDSGIKMSVFSTSGILTPLEAYGIDNKVDDGKPGTGNIYAAGVFGDEQPISVDTNANSCITNTTINTYYLASNEQNCRLMIGSALGN